MPHAPCPMPPAPCPPPPALKKTSPVCENRVSLLPKESDCEGQCAGLFSGRFWPYPAVSLQSGDAPSADRRWLATGALLGRGGCAAPELPPERSRGESAGI